MTRREKLDEIERMESAEISVICKKYKPLKDELKYQFKIEDIEAEGWEREDFYPALSGASYLTWFYINNKYPKKRKAHKLKITKITIPRTMPISHDPIKLSVTPTGASKVCFKLLDHTS